ncbi:MAG: amidohydrolase family protein [Bacteroidales bacterium]|nr:amidohydrolase family protein [Bacteroidales bacterium]
MADLISAGSDGCDLDQLDTITAGDFWGKYGRALDYCRNTSYYGSLIKGFQKLYDFKEPSFTESNISSLASLVEEKYKDNETWFDEASKKAGFELMFLCTGRFTIPLDKKYYVVSYYINNLVTYAGQKPAEGNELKGVYKDAAADGFKVSDLDSYLGYCDFMFKKYIDNRGVCIKNSLAYSRTLYYEDVPYDEARRLYSRPSADLSRAEVKKIEDFMFHWLIRNAVEYDLPVQIHTGYLANNGSTLENSMPLKLTNLLLQYPKAKFILFHGGFPWTGEFASLGKMFPNVYLDLVWLPQISREEAVQSLDLMLDCVPYNKFFWGGDCNNIEGETGALEYGKDVVAEVLAKRVKRGLLTEEVAMEILDRIFRGNAIELFRLEKILEGEI